MTARRSVVPLSAAIPFAALSICAFSACHRTSADGDAGALDAAAATSAAAGSSSSSDAAVDAGPSVPLFVAAPDAAAGPLNPRSPAKAGQVIDIPAGSFVAGSTPGDTGRDPTVEPADVKVDLGAFSIDALPFPNDPAAPARTNVSRADATAACAQSSGHLCSELEWERACKGAGERGEGSDFATGAVWDAVCEKEPTTCATREGVRAMGTAREWTQGDHYRGEGRRCAARTFVRDDTRPDPAATFRCCHGTPNTAPVPDAIVKPGYRKPKLDAAEMAGIFAKVPELARFAPDFHYYDPGDVNSIATRSTASHEAVTFTTQPLLWGPEAGEEVLVVAGHTKQSGFVVALYPLPNDKYRLASSFVLQNDLSPLALAFDPHNRKELIWTACWGCAGQQGHVSLRDDHRIVIVQD